MLCDAEILIRVSKYRGGIALRQTSNDCLYLSQTVSS